MNYPSAFYQQESDDDGTPLAGGFLRSVVAGTDTDSTTYLDTVGGTPNTNPIVLDAAGRYKMLLDPTVVYDLILTRADGTAVKTYTSVTAAAVTTDIVTSVNGSTGAVVLAAEDIGYTTATSTSWLGTPTNVFDALETVIGRADATPAASVSIADAGSYFAGTSAEAALQELGARTNSGAYLRTTIFTSTGTWTKATGVGSIVVEAVGAGGGCAANAAGLGGGGGGAYCFKRITSPAASYTVTVGTSSVGADGGDTTFGSVMTAGGGKLGPPVIGGVGGSASGGDLNLNGGGGGYGGSWSANVYFGPGGNSKFSGGAVGDLNNATGNVGQPSTGGGASGGTTTGAAGGSGVVLVHEYS